MPADSAQAKRYYDQDMDDSATTTDQGSRSGYSNFAREYSAQPERKWQIEVVRAIVRFARLQSGWDSYSAPPLRRDAGLFALEILQAVMRPRTPPPQVVPSSSGGVQLEWHEKGIDLELHITAPYECEMWFRDSQNPQAQPISLEITNDFSELKRPIELLSTR
jgi:hypothetical protein